MAYGAAGRPHSETGEASMKCPYCGRKVFSNSFWKGWVCERCGVGKYLGEGESELVSMNSGYETKSGFDRWWRLVPEGKLIVINERPE